MKKGRIILPVLVAILVLIVEIYGLWEYPIGTLIRVTFSSFLMGTGVGIGTLLGLHLRANGLTAGKFLAASLSLLVLALVGSAGVYLSEANDEDLHRSHLLGVLGGAALMLPIALSYEERLKRRSQ